MTIETHEEISRIAAAAAAAVVANDIVYIRAEIIDLKKSVGKIDDDIRIIQISSAKIDGKADQAAVANVRMLTILGILVSAASMIVVVITHR